MLFTQVLLDMNHFHLMLMTVKNNAEIYIYYFHLMLMMVKNNAKIYIY